MNRLSLVALPSLPAAIGRPDYDVAKIPVGVVHLGIGAFHRAHQAVYTDAILGVDPRWGICGVSLKTPRATAALAAQDGLYTVLEKGAAGASARVIGSVRETLFLGAERERVIARIADPTVTVVTLTVTEKGYCHDPATGRLNASHPEIAHDLAHPDAPTSAPGVLAAGLAARRASGNRPINVVCCDNLPHNGRMVEGIVAAFAQAHEPALAAWIARNVAFPCTMVDRIVPATTDADVADVAQRLGVADAAPVVCEPYRQWVIEDRFVAARPPWEGAGAQCTADVAPFETMKLRLLNGSHSALAYLGFLAGHEFIYQVAAQADFVAFMRALMAEVSPTLHVPSGVDLAAYRDALVLRFGNPALPHRTQQIAMDGSQKLPQRLLGTVRDNLAAGRPVDALSLAVAAWMRYATGVDEHGRTIDVQDPLAPEFARIAAENRGDAGRLARGFFAMRQIFGDDLPFDPRFTTPVDRSLAALLADGAARTVARAVGIVV